MCLRGRTLADSPTRGHGDAARGHKGMFRVKIRLFIYLALALSLLGQLSVMSPRADTREDENSVKL